MRAAILCPGPSLARTCPSDEQLATYDVTIGVNRAPLIRPFLQTNIDWWACGDWPLLFNLPISPRVGFCTMHDVIRLARSKPLWAANIQARWVSWDDLPVRPCYSTIAALSLAKHLGATDVTVFGDDKQGKQDFDKVNAGDNREDSRWAREKGLQTEALGLLSFERFMNAGVWP